MTVSRLIIKNDPIYFEFESSDVGDNVRIKAYFGLDCPRAIATIDRNQAHFLMLWLQEHLK